jgi:hypothetical protein
MPKRKFRITFRRYTDYNCIVEATTHAKAKMQVAYSLLDCKYFARFGDVLKEIEFCRVLEPMKRGRKSC